MKKLLNMVSALVLVVGLTASQASFAEFFAPPVAPVSPFGCATCGFPSASPFGMVYGSHGIVSPYGGGYFNSYGMYRHGYYGFGYRGFLARGGCGFPYRRYHRWSCGRGRRSFRAFSISIGGGFFNFSSVRF